MNTTGFLLTDELADLLLQTRLSIRFCVHAGRPDTYYRVMGSDFEKVKRIMLGGDCRRKPRTAMTSGLVTS